MSANLHVVLTYDPFISELVAEFYNENNIPNSALPYPFTIVATYRFIRNGILIQEINNGDRVTLSVPRPICSDGYSVFVTYTADDTIQPASSDSIVVGNDFIYGTFIHQSTIPGGVVLNLVTPPGVTPVGIQWAKNYQLFNPQPDDPLSIVANGNGIYEVRFQSLLTGLTYIAATEVTQSSLAMYVKTIGNDGNLYGLFGTPQNVITLLFFPIDANTPFRNRIYVNLKLVSDNSFISLVNLSAGDLINFSTIDCCDIVLAATTFILPCGTLPDVLISNDNNAATLNIKPFVGPINSFIKSISIPPKPKKLCGCRK